MPFPTWIRLLRENTNHPSSEGTFFIPTPGKNQVRRWIEAKACEREQAVLFADILRKELRQMRSAAAAAEARWSRRHDGDLDGEPPERLERLRGRIQEASTLLDALNARFLRT